MKKIPLAIFCGLFATQSFVLAAEEDNSFYGFSASASAALTTDYIWRGVSQSDKDPAMQGSFDLSHETGFYLGAWASSYEFSDNASLELDLYAGFSRETDFAGYLPFALTYDVGWLRYEYTDQSDLNFTELYFGASVSPLENFNFSAYYYYGLKIEHTLPGEYTDLAVDYTLPAAYGGITLLAHAGYYNRKGGADDYWDWKIGASRDLGGFNLEIAYTDTDDSGAGDLDDSRFVATISKELGGQNESKALLPEGFDTSVSVALTTDYVWRGVSQNRNNPSLQASFDIAHDSGFYVGVWGANVDFGGQTPPSLELDAYFGYGNETDFDGFLPLPVSYDISYLLYVYPSSSSSDVSEIIFDLGVSPLENLNLGISYAYGIEVEQALLGEYSNVAADYTLPDELGAITILSHVGYYNVKDGTDDYWDWKAAVAKDFGAFNFELAYTDTDDANFGSLDDSKIIGTISTTF